MEESPPSREKPVLQLTGKNGNAFNILALAQRAAKKAGWSEERVQQFVNEATGGDYDHLIQVVMRWFDVH